MKTRCEDSEMYSAEQFVTWMVAAIGLAITMIYVWFSLREGQTIHGPLRVIDIVMLVYGTYFLVRFVYRRSKVRIRIVRHDYSR